MRDISPVYLCILLSDFFYAQQKRRIDLARIKLIKQIFLARNTTLSQMVRDILSWNPET